MKRILFFTILTKIILFIPLAISAGELKVTTGGLNKTEVLNYKKAYFAGG